MDFMPCMYFIVTVWTVMLLIQWTQVGNGNYCDTDTQNPNYTFTETFEKSMDEVQCTARNENSVIIKLYRCVNGTGIPLKTCTNSQSTLTRRVSTNCAVTISGAENASETFYCTERGLIDRMDRLSAHYSVIVLSDASVDASVTVQTSSPTANVEFATSDQLSTELINDTSSLPNKNGGRSENMPVGMLVTTVLISILSTCKCVQT